MTVLMLEALGALLILVFIVWWTMFSGRKGGELDAREPDEPPHPAERDAAAEASTPPHDKS